jgi:hypothetical protein
LQSGVSLKSDLKQVREFIDRRPPPTRVEIAYVIAGRRSQIERFSPQDQFAGDVPVVVLSWDDVVDRLIENTPSHPPLQIVLAETVALSRRLLRALARDPSLLRGIDDRKFEELVATLLFDLGAQHVELTPARQDEGRNIIVTHMDLSGTRRTYLIECKHWVSGEKVTARWAISLLDIVQDERATGGILVSSSGFGPRLLEQEATFLERGLRLRDSQALNRWISIWQRQYGSVLIEPVDPNRLFDER